MMKVTLHPGLNLNLNSPDEVYPDPTHLWFHACSEQRLHRGHSQLRRQSHRKCHNLFAIVILAKGWLSMSTSVANAAKYLFGEFAK